MFQEQRPCARSVPAFERGYPPYPSYPQDASPTRLPCHLPHVHALFWSGSCATRQGSNVYVDFDSFFATAEQHLRPDLRGRPVASSRSTASTPASSPRAGRPSASESSGASGCARCGGPAPASCSCPPPRRLRAAAPRDREGHRPRRAHPRGALDRRDGLRALARRSGASRGARAGRQGGHRLRRGAGPHLFGRAGPTELLAKIAAEMEKPDGLVVIRPEELPGPPLRLSLTGHSGSRGATRPG